MDRWEYLVSEPYTLRHLIASYAVRSMPYVVDIGSYKIKPSVNGKLFCIDPLKTMVDSYHGTVKQWMDQNYYQIKDFTYGVVILGLDIEGGEEEFNAILDLIKNSSVTVLDVPIDHQPSVQQCDIILARCNKKVETEADFRYPELNLPGFPSFRNRKLYILKGDVC